MYAHFTLATNQILQVHFSNSRFISIISNCFTSITMGSWHIAVHILLPIPFVVLCLLSIPLPTFLKNSNFRKNLLMILDAFIFLRYNSIYLFICICIYAYAPIWMYVFTNVLHDTLKYICYRYIYIYFTNIFIYMLL